MAYDYIEQKPEFYDYYQQNPKLGLKKTLIIIAIIIALIVLLIVGYDTNRYFSQVSFWNKKVKEFESTQHLNGFDITNAAYKCLFTGQDYVKLADGVYLSIDDNNFKKNIGHITDVIESPKTALHPSGGIQDPETGELIPYYISIKEYFDDFSATSKMDLLPEFELVDGTIGKLHEMKQEVFVFPIPVTDRSTVYRRSEVYYKLYVFE